METMTNTQTPAWTLGDRLAKARSAAGIGSQDMADRLGVVRNTITNYEHDRTRVPHAVVVLWAQETNVPLDWLITASG
jgi:transcriptional regulator with XRE-family HTH domain